MSLNLMKKGIHYQEVLIINKLKKFNKKYNEAANDMQKYVYLFLLTIFIVMMRLYSETDHFIFTYIIASIISGIAIFGLESLGERLNMRWLFVLSIPCIVFAYPIATLLMAL